MKKSNYMTKQGFKRQDSFYQNKTISDIITPGLFGVVVNTEFINSDKFPLDIIKRADLEEIKKYFSAFYVTSEGTMIYDNGGWDEIRSFYGVAIIPDEYEDGATYALVHLFNGCQSFNQVYHTLIDIYRYSDVRENRVEYSHPYLPRRMTKAQIEEALGYSIIIEE